MEKVAIYPGSFNPWHKGHEDILKKALKIFDKVLVLQGRNPLKPAPMSKDFISEVYKVSNRAEAGFFTGLLADSVRDL